MKNVKTKKIKSLAVLALLCCIFMCCAGCKDQKADYAGTWIGNKGTTIVLSASGEAKYTQTSWKTTEDGQWKIADNRLIVSGIERLGYDIYANLNDSTSALLFQADNSSWGDETFLKAQ